MVDAGVGSVVDGCRYADGQSMPRRCDGVVENEDGFIGKFTVARRDRIRQRPL